jgi:hypothetical protein
MPTIIGQEVGPDYRGVPRRMSTEDVDLWYRFRERHIIKPTKLLFDVGVGRGKVDQIGIPSDWQDFWMRETQRRIDLLAIEPSRQIIIEFRKRALANALGRLIVYRQLLAQDPISPLPLETWLVTDTKDPELEALFAEHGVRWYVV